ncbi:hypothetical protein NL676_009362 [Syzygium grande]|nr:hypothetical protein NL676_009362 [Syzygium grande]
MAGRRDPSIEPGRLVGAAQAAESQPPMGESLPQVNKGPCGSRPGGERGERRPRHGQGGRSLSGCHKAKGGRAAATSGRRGWMATAGAELSRNGEDAEVRELERKRERDSMRRKETSATGRVEAAVNDAIKDQHPPDSPAGASSQSQLRPRGEAGGGLWAIKEALKAERAGPGGRQPAGGRAKATRG